MATRKQTGKAPPPSAAGRADGGGRAARRGPRADRGEIADRILAAARRSFAAHGYAGTTLRLVSREAGVDPSLVNYYFGNKDGLLQAALEPPADFLQGIAAAAAAPLPARGRAFVETMLGAWERPDSADVLRSIILTAAHEPAAMERLRAVFTVHILAMVSEHLGSAEEREVRAGMAASQIIGLVMVRYVWRIGAVAELPPEQVASLFAPTVQRYLAGPLPTC